MRKKPESGDLDVGLDDLLCFAVYGVAHAFNRAYKPLLEPLGLTYPQYLVMLTLWEEDGLPVKMIGERLGLDSGTLSPLLKRLEQAGLVERTRDRLDERQVRISLSPHGAEMKAEAARVTQAIGEATGCGLDEVVALRDALNGLRQKLLQPEA